MSLSGNTLTKSAAKVNFMQSALATFVFLAGVVASASVFLNDVYFWVQSYHFINPYLFLLALFLGVPRKIWGLMGLIFLLPLSAGLATQLNAYVGTAFLVLPNAGLDLAAGFFLGSLAKSLLDMKRLLGDKSNCLSCKVLMRQLAPWPIALVIVMITISTAIAISRNVYQSAAPTSFKGFLFNLVHFRPIGWHDDYMPISDWIAYSLAVAMVVLVIGYLKDEDNKNQVIFRAIMPGLIVGSLMGVAQALTGLGLPENLLNFRKDQLGYAVIGFQPDLHAFAGHMLLGVVGLWGYFYAGISKFERKIVAVVIAISWIGLVLSKSRALLLIALIAMFIWFLWTIWREKRELLVPVTILSSLAVGTFLLLIASFSNSLSGIPVLSWLGDLAGQFKSRDLTSWSLISGIFGARFEIWEGAIRMWSQFPFMGIGQGNFYRLSDIAQFSKSNFLILNHGENAHNYFLQTLCEVGFLGVIVFGVSLTTPFLKIKNKRALAPGLIALVGLFLGNIFSHSFLVRENLLLVSVIYALLCCGGSDSNQSPPKGSSLFSYRIKKYNFVKILIPLLTIAVILASINEVYASFGRLPFERGRFCYAEKDINLEDWTSGSFELPMPRGSSRLSVTFYLTKHQLDSLVRINMELINSDLRGVAIFQSLDGNKNHFLINFLLPQGSKIEGDNVKALILLNKCFTPRNLGINLDSRRLGLFGLSYKIY